MPTVSRATLDEIGEVRGGYVATPALRERGGEGWLRALQASDIDAEGSVVWSSLRWVAPPRGSDRYTVREGDVILPLRSVRLNATVARDVPPNVIAAGQWALISPDLAHATADYLAWYLNHPVTLARLGGHMQGTNLRFLSLGVLRSFEVELPAIELQHRIARAHSLNERVAALELRLADARRRYVDATTLTALHRAVGPNANKP